MTRRTLQAIGIRSARNFERKEQVIPFEALASAMGAGHILVCRFELLWLLFFQCGSHSSTDGFESVHGFQLSDPA